MARLKALICRFWKKENLATMRLFSQKTIMSKAKKLQTISKNQSKGKMEMPAIASHKLKKRLKKYVLLKESVIRTSLTLKTAWYWS